MAQCGVPGCKSINKKINRKSGLSFFTFPNKPSLREKWLHAIGRPGWDPQNYRVCSAHFKPDQIAKGGRIMPHRGAVPSVALPMPVDLETSSLQVCRICLASDVKMHSFQSGLLKTCMESILKLTDNAEIPGLPTFVCYECAPLLIKCHHLMQKCTLAQTALWNLLREHGEVTIEMVRKLNRDKINLASTLTHHYSMPTKTLYFIYNEDTRSSQLLMTKLPNKEENIKSDNEAGTSKIDISIFPEVTIKKYCPKITKMEIELDSMKMEELPPAEENDLDTFLEDNDDDNDQDYVPMDDDHDDDDDERQDEMVEIELSKIDSTTVSKPKQQLITSTTITDSEQQASNESGNGNGKEYKGLLRKMAQYFEIKDLETEEERLLVWQKYKGIDPEEAKKYEYECNHCSKCFIHEKPYKKHIATHTGPPSILCPLCKKGRFKNEESMREHYVANHSRQFTCKICSKMFPNFAFAERHMVAHKTHTNKCTECPFSTPRLQQLHEHMRAQHNAKHVCGRCARAFTGERAMKLHMAVAHGVCEQKQEFKCEECNLSFVTEEARKTHLLIAAKHKEGFKPTEQVLVATCLRCGLEFPSDLELRVHANTDHVKQGDGEKPKVKYPKKCDFCDTILTSRAEHWNHIQRRHPDKKNTYKPIINYICQVCGKGLGSTTKLEEHMTKHAGTPKYKCDVCDKAFYEKARLKVHKVVHTDEMQHHCDICGRRFKTRGSMMKHIKIHSSDLNYPCTYCGQRFKSADSLRMHKKSHMKDLATTSTWDEAFPTF